MFCLLLLATTVTQLVLSATTTPTLSTPAVSTLQAKNFAFQQCCANAGISGSNLRCCDYGLYTPSGGPTPPGAPVGELSLIQLQTARNCLKPSSSTKGKGGGSMVSYGGYGYQVGPPAPPSPPSPPGTQETWMDRGEHVNVFVCMLGWKDLAPCCSKEGHIP